ncbi:MAG: SMR family transporter [Clostridia bacterium]|nr:SMR family transporter [Clostridia bacterium]
MLYLLGAVLSSALVTIVMKASKPYTRSDASVLAANYMCCLALSFAYSGGGTLFSAAGGTRFAMLLGLVAGVFYVGTYKLLQWNILHNGAVLSAAFMKLGVLVPSLLAVLWFGERPRVPQIAGLVLAVAAILLLHSEKSADATEKRSGTKWMLVVLLLSGGVCDGLSKVYEVYGDPALESDFLLYLFAVAFLLCTATCLVKRERPGRRDLAAGVCIGVPNYFSTRFLLLSLSRIPAVVAYPTYSVSAILVVLFAGLAFFRERLSRRQWGAIGVILAALVLLNL